MLLALVGGLAAQPIYNMANLVVDDCEGFLLDSDAGDIQGTYDHNENFTFSICVPGADAITLSFLTFCTEADFDSLRLYDGPDTLSLQLGPAYTGEPDPPEVTATSGCLTVNFVSDPNVTCSGWTARWTTDFERPTPPDILPIDPLDCDVTGLTFTFDAPVHCDSIYPAAFNISGPLFPNVLTATPLACTDDSTTQVALTFGPPLNFSGSYQLTYTTSVTVCETEQSGSSRAEFVVMDCPLNILLELDGDAACANDSSLLVTTVSGGNPTYLTYEWAGDYVQSDTAVAYITPPGPTLYGVTVTDAAGASAEAQLLVDPLPVPQLSIGDSTLCQSAPEVVLTATPAGGLWTGLGFEGEESETGDYDPGLVTAPTDTIRYTDQNGCTNRAVWTIIPLDEGNADASCPGAAPFQVSGGLPAGGYWSGPNIDSTGLFTPTDTAASFLVIYTHPNGCTGEKFINIDTITPPPLDSICQSEPTFELPVTPFGGVWSGPGIVDEDTGEFDAHEAGPGAHTLAYEINGCSSNQTIFVRAIYAGEDFTVCPEQGDAPLPGDWQPTSGGLWTGLAITDGAAGTYDPSLLPDRTRDSLTFFANGCVDSRIAFVVQTTVVAERDTFRFCAGDRPVNLTEALETRPERGTWSGPGVRLRNDDSYLFEPDAAGTGTHALVFSANTCTDTIYAVVSATPSVTGATLCADDGPVPLDVDLPGGTWSGRGIINPAQGIFDPGFVGAGSYWVVYETVTGCRGADSIFVTEFVEAELADLEPFYCFQDTLIDMAATPNNGLLLIDSLPASSFNPALLGEGPHVITYTVGQGSCADTETRAVEIGAPVTVSVDLSTDSLCFGEQRRVLATAGGGSSNFNYTYIWDQGLGFGQGQQLAPLVSTRYVVTADDGCSDPARDTVILVVAPPITITPQTGPRVCFTDTTTASVTVSPAANYRIEWDSDPITVGNIIRSYPTAYTVTATDLLNGCAATAEVDLPGYGLLQANFNISPNTDCISTLQPEIQLLDFSVGGTAGYWDFGDGSARQAYVFGSNLFHTYTDTGTYQILLHLENEGNCVSEFILPVCVQAESRLFAPNAVTPNGDGYNETFGLVGTNIASIEWSVFNRYGQKVFTAADLLTQWQPRTNGTRRAEEVFTYVARYTTVGDAEERVLKGMFVVLW